MQGDARVIEYLNRGLRHELAAINQYWLHYRLLDNWGYRALAKKWRQESIEEMQHADKIVERIIFLDGFPNMQVIDPLRIGQNVKEVLDCDLAAEMSARALYQEAATHCHAVKDYVTRDLFEELMHDEEEHIDYLETQLDLVAKLGLELYAQHHIGKTDYDSKCRHTRRTRPTPCVGRNKRSALRRCAACYASHQSATYFRRRGPRIERRRRIRRGVNGAMRFAYCALRGCEHAVKLRSFPRKRESTFSCPGRAKRDPGPRAAASAPGSPLSRGRAEES